MNTRFVSLFTLGFRVGWGLVLLICLSGAFSAEAQTAAAPPAEEKGAMSASFSRSAGCPSSSFWKASMP